MNNASAALDLVIEYYWKDAKTGKIKKWETNPKKARIAIRRRERRNAKKGLSQKCNCI